MNGFRLAVASLVFSAGVAFAGPPTGIISGQVKFATDQSPAPYRYVYLIRCTESTDEVCIRDFKLGALSDASGYYTFDLSAANLPEGTYQIRQLGGGSGADGMIVSATHTATFPLSDIVNKVTDIVLPPNDIQVPSMVPCSYRLAPHSVCTMEYTVKNVTKRNLEIDAVVLIEWNAGFAIANARQQVGVNGNPTPQRVTLNPGESQTLTFSIKVGNVPTGSYFYASLFTYMHGRPFKGNGQSGGWMVDVVTSP